MAMASHPAKPANPLVDQAVQAALSNRGPVEVDLPDGGWFVVHPQADFVMLSVGQGGSQAAHAVDVLQRRLYAPERFGSWMPAALNDDSLIAVQRLDRGADGGVAPFDDTLLAQARELLSCA